MFAALNSFLTRAVSGYFLNKSLRFRSSASAFLSRTFAGTPNTYTYSVWFKRGTLGVQQELVASRAGTASFLELTSSDTITCGLNNVSICTSTAVFRDPAAWYHAVLTVTQSSTVTIYINGVSVATGTAGASSFLFNSSYTNTIGQYGNANSLYFDGEMAEINFVDGQALAPTAFGAYSIYNQWLPIRYAGTYGTNGFYLPFTGSTTSTAYSGAFNGSTQYLSLANNTLLSFGSGDFTIEGWVYANALGSYNAIFGQWLDSGSTVNNSYVLESVGSTMFFYWVSGTTLYGPATLGTITTGAWIHYAICRSGSTLYPFKNGVLGTTVSITQTLNSPTTNVTVGGQIAGAGYWDGYISNLRVVKGTAVYTTTFTPSTVPLTAIANTSLLTLQNATIVDNSGNSLAITNFNAVTTTVQSPFVTSMIAADSSGNGNNWSTNNISLTGGSTYDSLTDVPTLTSATVANYAVLNPLSIRSGAPKSSDGNLTIAWGGTYPANALATIGVSTGKWYWEVGFAGGTFSNNPQVGVAVTGWSNLNADPATTASPFSHIVGGNSSFWNNGTATANSVSYGPGDTVGVALNCDTNVVSFYKNNTLIGTAQSIESGQTWFPIHANSSYTALTQYANYGQRPFVYTAPSGFLPLNTFNI